MPNTIVTTIAEIDYGAGPTSQVIFDDANYIVDKATGALAIHTSAGTVASFGPGQWRFVHRDLVFRANAGATHGSLT